MNHDRWRAGFTLIELLVVIAIISFIASILFASFSTARAQARTVRRVQDISEVQKALELYRAQTGSYPVSTSLYNPSGAVCLECDDPTYRAYANIGAINNLQQAIGPNSPYLKQWPKDPSLPPSGVFAEPYRGYWYQSDGQNYKFVNIIYNDPVNSVPTSLQDSNFVSNHTGVSGQSSSQSATWRYDCIGNCTPAPPPGSFLVNVVRSGAAVNTGFTVSSPAYSGVVNYPSPPQGYGLTVAPGASVTFTMNPPACLAINEPSGTVGCNLSTYVLSPTGPTTVFIGLP